MVLTPDLRLQYRVMSDICIELKITSLNLLADCLQQSFTDIKLRLSQAFWPKLCRRPVSLAPAKASCQSKQKGYVIEFSIWKAAL